MNLKNTLIILLLLASPICRAQIPQGQPVSGSPVLGGVANSSGNAQFFNQNAAGQLCVNGLPILQAGYGTNSGAVTFSTTTAQAVATTDAANDAAVSVQVSSSGTNSTVTFQGSNDDTNWVGVVLENVGTNTQSGSSTLTAAGILAGTLSFRYFRLNVTGITAGTTAGTVYFFAAPRPTLTIGGSVVLTANTSGGDTPFYLSNVAGTVTSIKSSGGTLYGLTISNTQASAAAYVQLFNTASGSVTLGTTAPVFEVYVPAATTVSVNVPTVGDSYSTALSVASTTADKGATGSASGVIVSGEYK